MHQLAAARIAAVISNVRLKPSSTDGDSVASFFLRRDCFLLEGSVAAALVIYITLESDKRYGTKHQTDEMLLFNRGSSTPKTEFEVRCYAIASSLDPR